MKILKITSTDQVGIISKISTVLFENRINIIKLDEYVTPDGKMFFFRAQIEGDDSNIDLKREIGAQLHPNTTIELITPRAKDVIIMATKEPHCLGDLLLRANSKSLNINIKAVIANHNDLRELVEKFNIPFILVPHGELNREDHSKLIQKEIDQINFDYIILAKYMRILPESFVNAYSHKIINIHHSFLPAFIGANPYKQAFARGVKIIGATSHFVTKELDEGPIIEQDILSIDHSYTSKELSAMGKDVEQLVLSKALKYVTEDRVFVYENKTVVFK